MNTFLKSFLVSSMILMSTSVFSGTVTVNGADCGQLTGSVTVDAAGNVVIVSGGNCGSFNTHDLAVTSSGNGVITSTPGGMSVSSTTKTQAFLSTDSVVLTAVPGTGQNSETFTGWGAGACSAQTGDTCTVLMEQDQSVVGSFSNNNGPIQYTLTVSKPGLGSNGTVTGVGINCGDDCEEAYDEGTEVDLAAAGNGDAFTGWGGDGVDCPGTGSCTVTMGAAKDVTATFNVVPNHTLTVSFDGTGTGTVSSDPVGINCGAACSESFSEGLFVTLTPAADTGSLFGGWGGACSGMGPCVVTMGAAKDVTATFNDSTVSGCGTTPSGVNIVDRSWPGGINSENFSMTSGATTAIRITTTADGSLKGQFATVPTANNGAWHTVAMSACPGDFSTSLGTRCVNEGSETTTRWKQDAPQTYRCGLEPNTSYYINIAFRSASSSASTCSGTCTIIAQNYYQKNSNIQLIQALYLPKVDRELFNWPV